MFDFDVRSGQDAAFGELLPEMLGQVWRPSKLHEEFSRPIADIPRRAPLVLAPSCTLREASRLIGERHGGAALVGSHGVLLGVLGAHEILGRMLRPDSPTADVPVFKVMAPRPETLLDNDTVAYAVRKLSVVASRSMPIVRPSGALLGLLEAQDVMAWICLRLGVASLPERWA